MKIIDRFFNSFESSVESLRLNKILLSNAQKEVIEKSKEYINIEKQFNSSKEYFLKSQMGKPILESMENNFNKQKREFESFCQNAEKKQKQLKNQSHRIYKSNPALRILQEFNDFIPENKFNSILVNLVKGHQEGLIDSNKLLDLKTYKRIDLEKGSVFVKDNRTHYSDVIVLNEDNEVLFLVRNKIDEFQPKKYCFPGGHVEQGEDYAYSASRELVEETGISIESTELVNCGTYTDNKVVIHYFTAKINKEKVNIVLDEREHEQYEWVKLEDVKNYPLILNLKDNLEKVISIPVEFFLNDDPTSKYGFYYINGQFLKKEDEQLAKSLSTVYAAFRTGEISQEIYEKQLKESRRDIETFNLYKSNGNTLYSVRISDNLEKSQPHKYYYREGVPGNYKYYYTRDEYFQAKGKNYLDSKPKQDIVEIIETSLEPKIQEIIQKTEEAEFTRTGFHVTDFDKEMIRLSLLQDMFNSIGKYIEKTDELIDFNIGQSIKGNFVIQMSIKRDGQLRYLETDVIQAGGYNIQKLHLRYITNTDLVQKDTVLTDKFKQKADKLTKLQKLEKDVKYYEEVVTRYQREIAEREAMSDEEKALAGGGYDIMKNTKWEDLVSRGASKNFDNSEAVFIAKREKLRQDNIKRYNEYTGYVKQYLKSAEKDLTKRIKRVEDFSQPPLDDTLEKAMPHKYIKREGSPGNYKYIYEEKIEDKNFEVNSFDPYTYKDTNVLVNKFGVKDLKELIIIERDIVKDKLKQINKVDYTSNGFKDIHNILFGDLYDWAGKTRNVNLSNGNVTFVPMRFIEDSLNTEFDKISNDIKNKDKFSKEDWVKKAANYFGELIFIHPFREGNGRTTRKFIDLFLNEKELFLDWRRINKEEYFKASEFAINKADNSLLEKLFIENVV